MNKFEENWRKKFDELGEQKDSLKEKVRADMWKNILASKNGFEQDWQKKGEDSEAWKGALTEADKKILWHKIQTSLTQFEQQWQEKIEEDSRESGLFLDEVTKERIGATVLVEKENFELDWQNKINDPVLAGQDILNASSRNRIWHKVQSANTNTATFTSKLKRKPVFALRWSHAAALFIGAFSAWLIWDRSSTPLQNTLVVAPQPELITPVAAPDEIQNKIIPDLEKGASGIEEGTASKPFTKPIAKVKPIAPSRGSRRVIERVAGKVTSVKPLQSAVVLAKSSPVTNTGKTIPIAEKAGNRMQEQDLAVAIAKAAPVKKVVHISDIRPAEVPSKGTAIYGRAFGEGKEKRNEKSTMTFNSVLKNYK